MDNITSYLRFRTDISLKKAELNEADVMVFASLIGMDYEGLTDAPVTIEELSKLYFDRGRLDNRDERIREKEQLLRLAAAGERFKNVLFTDYVKDIDEEQEKTFYAATYVLNRHLKLIVFRGTDGSLLSWKENFDCLYKFPSPGQLQAKAYVENAIKKTKNPFVKFVIGGHSKGGNLACYSSVFAEEKLQKRISSVYLLDSPGFIQDLGTFPAFARVKSRIKKFVPENCVIGNLMQVSGERSVVKCVGKGIYQHDMFTWQVNARGVDLTESESELSLRLSERVNNWIDAIPLEERKTTVDELFNVFERNGIMHFSDLMHIDLRGILGMIMSATRLSSENRRLLGIIFKEVIG